MTISLATASSNMILFDFWYDFVLFYFLFLIIYLCIYFLIPTPISLAMASSMIISFDFLFYLDSFYLSIYLLIYLFIYLLISLAWRPSLWRWRPALRFDLISFLTWFLIYLFNLFLTLTTISLAIASKRLIPNFWSSLSHFVSKPDLFCFPICLCVRPSIGPVVFMNQTSSLQKMPKTWRRSANVWRKTSKRKLPHQR